MSIFRSYDYRSFLFFLLIKMSSLQTCVPFAYDLPQNTSSWPPSHAPPHIHTHKGVFSTKPWSPWAVDLFKWDPYIVKAGKTLQIWSNLILFLSTEAKRRGMIFPCCTGSWEQLFSNSVRINWVHPVHRMDCSLGSTTLCLGDVLPSGDNQRSEQMPLASCPWETSPVKDERERLKSSIWFLIRWTILQAR